MQAQRLGLHLRHHEKDIPDVLVSDRSRLLQVICSVLDYVLRKAYEHAQQHAGAGAAATLTTPSDLSQHDKESSSAGLPSRDLAHRHIVRVSVRCEQIRREGCELAVRVLLRGTLLSVEQKQTLFDMFSPSAGLSPGVLECHSLAVLSACLLPSNPSIG